MKKEDPFRRPTIEEVVAHTERGLRELEGTTNRYDARFGDDKDLPERRPLFNYKETVYYKKVARIGFICFFVGFIPLFHEAIGVTCLLGAMGGILLWLATEFGTDEPEENRKAKRAKRELEYYGQFPGTEMGLVYSVVYASCNQRSKEKQSDPWKVKNPHELSCLDPKQYLVELPDGKWDYSKYDEELMYRFMVLCKRFGIEPHILNYCDAYVMIERRGKIRFPASCGYLPPITNDLYYEWAIGEDKYPSQKGRWFQMFYWKYRDYDLYPNQIWPKAKARCEADYLNAPKAPFDKVYLDGKTKTVERDLESFRSRTK